jgi:hypothetical protein
MVEAGYSFCIALFALHELDAVRCHEWRLIPLIRRLPDNIGYTVFVAAHLPLFLLIFWLGWHSTPETKNAFYIFVGVFSIVHIWLHKLFASHPANEFNNPFSQTLIWGWGATGLLLLALMAV